jgi:hypothetical protein
VLPDALRHFGKECPALRPKADRLLAIWKERKIFSKEVMGTLGSSLHNKRVDGGSGGGGGASSMKSRRSSGSGLTETDDIELIDELLETAETHTMTQTGDASVSEQVAGEFAPTLCRHWIDFLLGPREGNRVIGIVP